MKAFPGQGRTCGTASLKCDTDNHQEIFMQAHGHEDLSASPTLPEPFSEWVRNRKKKLWALIACTLRAKSNDQHQEAHSSIPVCDEENHLSVCRSTTSWEGSHFLSDGRTPQPNVMGWSHVFWPWYFFFLLQNWGTEWDDSQNGVISVEHEHVFETSAVGKKEITPTG